MRKRMSDLSITKRMKGIAKAALALTACLILPLASLPASAASNEMPDPDRSGSISITFTDPETKKPISDGSEVALYRVAGVKIENGFKFEYEGDFAAQGEAPKTDEDFTKELAADLWKIAQDKVSPSAAKQKFGEDGKVTFEDLKPGIYLIGQTVVGGDKVKFKIDPFLVTIPNKGEGEALIYDVNATPKVDVVKETKPTPPPEPDKPIKPHRIPQTGQLWWPVMALGFMGAVLIGAGLAKKMKG